MSLPGLSGSILFIYAKDFPASCRYYGQVLGLPVAGSLGANVQVFSLPGSYVGVVRQGVSAAANPPRCAAEKGDTAIVGLVCASAEDVDRYHARLKASRLGKVLSTPTRNDTFGIYNMMARDPNGYLVEVQSFLKPGVLAPTSTKAMKATRKARATKPMKATKAMKVKTAMKAKKAMKVTTAMQAKKAMKVKAAMKAGKAMKRKKA